MFKNINYLVCLLIALAMQVPALAQTQEIIEQKIETILLERQPFTSKLYYMDMRGNYRQLQYGIQQRGKALTQPLSNQLVLYRESVNEEGETVYIPATSIAIPSEEKVVLFFYGNKEGKFNHFAVANDPQKYPAGSARIINLTGEKAYLHLSGDNYQVKPQSEVAIKNVTNGSKDFTFGYAVDLEGPSNNRANIQNLRMGHPSMRFLAVIAYETYEEPGVDPVRIPVDVRLYDIVMPPKG